MNEYTPVPKTPENTKSPLHNQRMAALERARQTPREKRSPRLDLKTEYLDDARWVELATARGLSLPQTTTAPTSGKIESWYHRLGLTGQRFTAWCGYSPSGWIAANPTWSLRALVGLLLEDFPA